MSDAVQWGIDDIYGRQVPASRSLQTWVVRVKSTTPPFRMLWLNLKGDPPNLWLPDRILISHGARVVFLLVWLKLV